MNYVFCAVISCLSIKMYDFPAAAFRTGFGVLHFSPSVFSYYIAMLIGTQ